MTTEDRILEVTEAEGAPRHVINQTWSTDGLTFHLSVRVARKDVIMTKLRWISGRLESGGRSRGGRGTQLAAVEVIRDAVTHWNRLHAVKIVEQRIDFTHSLRVQTSASGVRGALLSSIALELG